jgi:hypothetical protein
VCGQLNVLNAQLVALAAEALETGLWQGWGIFFPDPRQPRPADDHAA